MPANSLRDLAKQVYDLDRRVRAKGSTSQLAHSSIEDGALQAYDRTGTQTMAIGKQWDGTYAPTVTNGPIPPTPTGLTVQDATEGLIIGWDGTFAGGLIPAPMDFLRVDAHVGASSDFIPDHTNRRATFVSPQGGFASVTVPYGTYFVKLVCWTFAGRVSLASDPVEGDSWPVEVSSDGFPPASSPAVELIGGYEILLARWSAIINADPVTYKVYIGTSAGFTKDATTLAGITNGTQFTIKALPGTPPANPGDPDPRKLQYDVDYYVAIEATDDDGAAPVGAESVSQIFKITGGAIQDGTIVGQNIVGGTITGDLLAGSIVLSSAFWTALTGQRAGFTPDGFFAYKSDDSLMFKLPTDGSNALYDGELVVRGATILGGMSIQSDENELTADGKLTLMRGIVSPTASPQLSNTYDYVTPSTASLTTAQKTNNDPDWGLGAAFDLNPGQVTHMEWRSALGFWSVYQIRTNGTREWYINPDGTPHDLTGGGVYYSDFKDWEVWSATELLSSSIPAQNGHYLMFRFMPSGDDYWVSAPTGLFRYSRQNGSLPPALTNDGVDMMVAETISGGILRVRTYRPTGSSGVMPAPLVAHESSAGYNSSLGICALQYSATRFDFGTSAGFLTAERGVSNPARVVYFSGTNANSIFPHGTTVGTGWSSANKEAGSFEAPSTNRRACGWDGTNFFSYHNDGKLYKHTSTAWDPAVTSSKVWSQLTFYDSDAAGTGTHETTPGAAVSFTWNRRAKLHFVAPNVPDNGGTDDPNAIRLYVGRGATVPANSAMYLQYTGIAATDLSSLSTVTANPPTVNGFPSANPAKIVSDDGLLEISGAGTIKVNGTLVAIGSPTVTYITSSGTWTRPAGLKAAYVEAVGGAGGDGGVAAIGTTGSPGQAESGGGGGGSYSAKWYLLGDLSATESVTIGAGGNGGSTAGSDGTAGGSTVFKGQTAGPGLGGAGVTTANANRTVTGTGASAGGNGGTATGGDINISGEDGGHGRWMNGLALLAARGGAPPMGFGLGGNARTGAGANPGKGYGGGAGPAFAGNAAVAGAAGTQGIVKITCYF